MEHDGLIGVFALTLTLNQCNTIFAMRTFDDTGKEFLSNYLGRSYSESLHNLQPQQAVLFGKASSCENPVLISLNDRNTFTENFRVCNPPPGLPHQEQPKQSDGDAEQDVPF